MSPPQASVNRHLVGLISLFCLTAGFSVGIFDSAENVWCASLIRAGVVLAALWLALPTRGRAAAWANVSPWWFIGGAGVLVLIARRPQVMIPIVVVMLLALVFVPPNRR